MKFHILSIFTCIPSYWTKNSKNLTIWSCNLDLVYIYYLSRRLTLEIF